MNHSSSELLVVPTLRFRYAEDGRVILTKKFIEGVSAYCKYWPGAVTVIAKTCSSADDNLDHVCVSKDELPFGIESFPHSREDFVKRISRARVLAATLSSDLLNLVDDCSVAEVALIWIAELSVNTRCQIIDADVANPLRRFKRKLNEHLLEVRYRRALDRSSGVQCNGTPVFDEYGGISPNALLFFDSRVTSELLIPQSVLKEKIQRYLNKEKLRLGFSGRLVAIKGVTFLPEVADMLRARGVNFSMDIYGDGNLVPDLKAAIDKLGLANHVRLKGVLEFEKQLLPAVQESIDLFVCCHTQGDPSCTYLETLSCGVPIVGFSNEAWSGLARESRTGWVVPMKNSQAMADQIAELETNRQELADAAEQALLFSSKHTFESTTKQRVEHFLRCAP